MMTKPALKLHVCYLLNLKRTCRGGVSSDFQMHFVMENRSLAPDLSIGFDFIFAIVRRGWFCLKQCLSLLTLVAGLTVLPLLVGCTARLVPSMTVGPPWALAPCHLWFSERNLAPPLMALTPPRGGWDVPFGS